MCGICGIVNISGERQPESVRLRVSAMLQALSHRGPDDVGLNASESAVLGATRLAIRGGDDGRQPMVDAASGVQFVTGKLTTTKNCAFGWPNVAGR